MLILLTNDDGIYAPGLTAMERALAKFGDVNVVAPATEQSGVGHAITVQNPLIIHEVFESEESIGWLQLDDDIRYYAKGSRDGPALGPEERAKLMSRSGPHHRTIAGSMTRPWTLFKPTVSP